ncbi:hypothetical protein BDK51DRAFT_53219 [Blyttiomyces helicus]|uniref:HAMP domain-containing protein n=1 Tax=Blyttiomyces helicus TaxID=388810 RepID=A0A4P9WQ25_9FUNG|nr:hypothetical protein BDK51DRAFT_53219 [Blyttiomyces helicus]|eukprot:RKO94253.1 hypothetical protein BDK51DRAFT_53219 [Blyttiomyces helicus]
MRRTFQIGELIHNGQKSLASVPSLASLRRDSSGAMIASNIPDQVLVPPNFGSQFQATTVNDTLIAQSAAAFVSTYQSFANVPDFASITYDDAYGRGEILVNAHWITDGYGTNWMLSLIVPKNDFLGTLKQAQSNVEKAVIGATIAMATISALLAFFLVYPIRRLTAIMIQATAFDFSAVREGYLSHSSPWEPAEIAKCKNVFAIMLGKFATAIKQNKGLTGNQVNSGGSTAKGSSPAPVMNKIKESSEY